MQDGYVRRAKAQRPPSVVKPPPPVLAERPARPLLPERAPKGPLVRTMETPVLTVQQSLEFAQKLMKERRPLPVVVVAANSGGVLVTNRMFKGKLSGSRLTSQWQYCPFQLPAGHGDCSTCRAHAVPHAEVVKVTHCMLEVDLLSCSGLYQGPGLCVLVISHRLQLQPRQSCISTSKPTCLASLCVDVEHKR